MLGWFKQLGFHRSIIRESAHFFWLSNCARSWLLKSSSTLSSSQLSSQTFTSSSFSFPSAHSTRINDMKSAPKISQCEQLKQSKSTGYCRAGHAKNEISSYSQIHTFNWEFLKFIVLFQAAKILLIILILIGHGDYLDYFWIIRKLKFCEIKTLFVDRMLLYSMPSKWFCKIVVTAQQLSIVGSLSVALCEAFKYFWAQSTCWITRNCTKLHWICCFFFYSKETGHIEAIIRWRNIFIFKFRRLTHNVDRIGTVNNVANPTKYSKQQNILNILMLPTMIRYSANSPLHKHIARSAKSKQRQEKQDKESRIQWFE